MKKSIELIIPDSLNEITLGQYKAFLKESENKSELRAKELMLVHFCNLDKELLQHIPLRDVNTIADQIESLFTNAQDLQTKVTIDGIEYGFIPNLDEMTLGEYADLDKYCNDWQTMDKAMAVLFRPIHKDHKGKYLIEPYNGTKDKHEVMNSLPMNVVNGALGFFFDLGSDLLGAIPSYLMEEIATMNTASRPNLQSSGDGTQAYTNLLKEILGDWTKYPR